MTYAIIQPPFTLQFDRMSKRELQDYAAWFIEMVPIRQRELAAAVETTPAYGAWRADHTDESLTVLGEWFAREVSTRPRTTEEMLELASKVPARIAVSSPELTNRTYSLAIDIGMYLGEVMLKTVPDLRWEQPLKSKRDADYGQMCIKGPNLIAMNTVRLVVVLAFGIDRNSKDGRGLRDVYDIWSGPKSPLFSAIPERKSRVGS